MFVRSLILTLMLLLSQFAKAQQEDHDHHHDHDHDHQHDPHDHHNHLGLALGPVYVFGEEEWAPGLHFHYTRLFDVGKSQVGLGLGLESILDEHRHYSTSLNLSYLPIHNLTFTVAPGIQYGPEGKEFTTHFEVSYEFILGKIHLGPVIEYAYAAEDAHMLAGLHLGYGF